MIDFMPPSTLIVGSGKFLHYFETKIEENKVAIKP